MLRGRPPTAAGRPGSYEPGIFDTVEDVDGDRVLLVEDTWISGATALSAAGNLLEAGANSVVIVPLAREMKLAYHRDLSPEYISYLDGLYDVKSWPRT
jgi:hypoxanthine-guanine phosphoribosyltransferase